MADEKKKGRKTLIAERRLRTAEIAVLDDVILGLNQDNARGLSFDRMLRRIEISRRMAKEELADVNALLGDGAIAKDDDDDAGEAADAADDAVADEAEQVTG